jgi:hypothetical protein
LASQDPTPSQVPPPRLNGDTTLASQDLTSPKVPPPRFNRKTAFYTGLFFGSGLGLLLSSGCSFLYLLVSQDSISVRNGQMSFSKSVNTTTLTENLNQSIQGNRNAIGNDNGVANSGDNSQVARDPKGSFNTQDSPSIFGNNNSVTIVANRDLPGFDEKSYLSTPPSELGKYAKTSDFQPDSLVRSASDTEKIQFGKQEPFILGKLYTSFFDVNRYANESRFVFKLDGTQKAVLLQFGLPDLQNGSTTTGLYIVKISVDGKPVWAGECRRSQGNQIISVPLDAVDKKTLTIEVTSNSKNETNLFFTEARILK